MSMRGCALAFLLVCAAPTVVQGTTTPRLTEALPEDKCGDPEVRELIAEGHDFLCYATGDSFKGTGFCTISGKCAPRVATPRVEATTTRDFLVEAVAREGRNFAALTTRVRHLFSERKESAYVSLVRPFGRASSEHRSQPEEAETIATTTDYRSLKKACEGALSKVLLSIVPVVRSAFCDTEAVPEHIAPFPGKSEGSVRSVGARGKSVGDTPPPPHVALIAEPAQVPLSGRSMLLWRAENVKPFSCRIEGPGLAKERLPVEGSLSTPAIIDHSTYTVTCESEGGGKAVSRASIDIGL